jgi:hypothetical protein
LIASHPVAFISSFFNLAYENRAQDTKKCPFQHFPSAAPSPPRHSAKKDGGQVDVIAFNNLAIDLFPTIKIPKLTIQTSYPNV